MLECVVASRLTVCGAGAVAALSLCVALVDAQIKGETISKRGVVVDVIKVAANAHNLMTKFVKQLHEEYYLKNVAMW